MCKYCQLCYVTAMPQLTNDIQRLPCVFDIELVDLLFQFYDLFRLDLDVCGLTLFNQSVRMLNAKHKHRADT